MPQALTARQVLDAEYLAASSCNSNCPPGGRYAPDCCHPECLFPEPESLDCVRSRPSPKRTASTMAARAVRLVGGNTPSNRLAWLEVRLFLEDQAVGS
jgi:hypothetical protein